MREEILSPAELDERIKQKVGGMLTNISNRINKIVDSNRPAAEMHAFRKKVRVMLDEAVFNTEQDVDNFYRRVIDLLNTRFPDKKYKDNISVPVVRDLIVEARVRAIEFVRSSTPFQNGPQPVVEKANGAAESWGDFVEDLKGLIRSDDLLDAFSSDRELTNISSMITSAVQAELGKRGDVQSRLLEKLSEAHGLLAIEGINHQAWLTFLTRLSRIGSTLFTNGELKDMLDSMIQKLEKMIQGKGERIKGPAIVTSKMEAPTIAPVIDPHMDPDVSVDVGKKIEPKKEKKEATIFMVQRKTEDQKWNTKKVEFDRLIRTKGPEEYKRAGPLAAFFVHEFVNQVITAIDLVEQEDGPSSRFRGELKDLRAGGEVCTDWIEQSICEKMTKYVFENYFVAKGRADTETLQRRIFTELDTKKKGRSTMEALMILTFGHIFKIRFDQVEKPFEAFSQQTRIFESMSNTITFESFKASGYSESDCVWNLRMLEDEVTRILNRIRGFREGEGATTLLAKPAQPQKDEAKKALAVKVGESEAHIDDIETVEPETDDDRGEEVPEVLEAEASAEPEEAEADDESDQDEEEAEHGEGVLRVALNDDEMKLVEFKCEDFYHDNRKADESSIRKFAESMQESLAENHQAFHASEPWIPINSVWLAKRVLGHVEFLRRQGEAQKESASMRGAGCHADSDKTEVIKVATHQEREAIAENQRWLQDVMKIYKDRRKMFNVMLCKALEEIYKYEFLDNLPASQVRLLTEIIKDWRIKSDYVIVNDKPSLSIDGISSDYLKERLLHYLQEYGSGGEAEGCTCMSRLNDILGEQMRVRAESKKEQDTLRARLGQLRAERAAQGDRLEQLKVLNFAKVEKEKEYNNLMRSVPGPNDGPEAFTQWAGRGQALSVAVSDLARKIDELKAEGDPKKANLDQQIVDLERNLASSQIAFERAERAISIVQEGRDEILKKLDECFAEAEMRKDQVA